MLNNQQQPHHQLTHLVSIPEEDASSCSSSTSVFKDTNDAENQQVPLQKYNNRIKQDVDKNSCSSTAQDQEELFSQAYLQWLYGRTSQERANSSYLPPTHSEQPKNSDEKVAEQCTESTSKAPHPPVSRNLRRQLSEHHENTDPTSHQILCPFKLNEKKCEQEAEGLPGQNWNNQLVRQTALKRKRFYSESLAALNRLSVDKTRQTASSFLQKIDETTSNNSRSLEKINSESDISTDDEDEVVQCNLTGRLKTLKEKARTLASKLNIIEFKASRGWLEKFKHRHGIRFKMEQGEAGAVDVESLARWQGEVLRSSLVDYSPNDIFNVDETGLFWKVLPKKTMAFQEEKCAGGKKSKERVTVLVGGNMSGSEKIPLLVIGRSAKPRCFKNAMVPVEYKANKKAWMTGELFEGWLKAWDRKLKKDGRKVLLYLDNCSAHPPNVTLECIKVRFFPPNTTALSQPMDQGIIQNLKVQYRRYLLRERIKAIDNKQDFRFNLLNALHLLRRAWGDVKPETVRNCFRKASFVVQESVLHGGDNFMLDPDLDELLYDPDLGELIAEPELDDEMLAEYELDDELLELWNGLRLQGEIGDGVELANYLNLDSDLATDGVLSLDELAEDVLTTEGNQSAADIDVDSDVEMEEAPITRLEAQRALRLVRQYVENNFANPELLRQSDALDEAFWQDGQKKRKQSSLSDFFKPLT